MSDLSLICRCLKKHFQLSRVHFGCHPSQMLGLYCLQQLAFIWKRKNCRVLLRPSPAWKLRTWQVCLRGTKQTAGKSAADSAEVREGLFSPPREEGKPIPPKASPKLARPETRAMPRSSSEGGWNKVTTDPMTREVGELEGWGIVRLFSNRQCCGIA